MNPGRRISVQTNLAAFDTRRDRGYLTSLRERRVSMLRRRTMRPKMNERLFDKCIQPARLTLLALTLALTGGCGPEPREPTILQARAQSFVVDVPLPDKFNQDRRKSTHSLTAGRRNIKHHYLGSASPLSVSNFYRQKMPDHQWELLDRTLKNGIEILNYRKGEEKCEIRIEEMPGGLFGSKTRISVLLQPDQ